MENKKLDKSSKKQIFPLRESASIIILEDALKPDKLLMFKRKANMSFGSAVVFPGGACDKEDKQFCMKIAQREQFQQYSKITAIRELFQQTGILLLPFKDQILIQQIKRKNITVKQFGYEFICKIWKNHLHMMIPLIRFLTVQVLPGKRFDTIFFTPDPKTIRINLSNLGKQKSLQNLQNLKISSQGQNYFWQSSQCLLKLYQKGEIHLIPPQFIILSCLKNLKSFEQILQLNPKYCTEPILMNTDNLRDFTLIGDKDYNWDLIMKKQPQSQSKHYLKEYMGWYLNRSKIENIEITNKNRRFKFDGQQKILQFKTDYVEHSLLGLFSVQNAKL